ncbi:CAAX protease self-immunity protein (macronuclear) [Tetrahymena thermophila SB210]|uniref:CAAX protease self-immunity protein n=1 Tax=Tetrahymena thermophila (strain SB210) TaxID=312017 RepID=Q234H5_TETTS|nr:CAAX protease self-immunity protein [Tetrahymena thermophila SB210]EAR92028.2 CAAX protease self-immunity protein [Tetrahymena thermophila SB210]|eukprot:XP_001012273.2 CAAX protease self-immunity protein [Tetrahymena thermophila SB210]
MDQAFKQNLWKLIYLEINMVTPIIIMCISLIYFDMYTLTIFLYNSICLVIMPAIYIKFILKDPKKKELSYYFRNRLENPKKQMIVGFILFSVIYAAIVINYDICENYFKKEIIDEIHVNFDKKILNFVVLVIIFGFCNPFLEEWYWRNFIPQAIFDLLNHSYNNENENQDDRLEQGSGEFHNFQDNDLENRINDQYNSQLEYNVESNRPTNKLSNKNVEIFQLLYALHYSSYHFFVVMHITNPYFAIAGTLVVWIAGRVFLLINNKVGFIANGLAHMGADVGFCTLALVIFYNNKIL